MIREVNYQDLEGILSLYLHLHEKEIPKINEHVASIWNKIINDEDYHLIVAEEDGKIVSSCTCIVVPNMTRQVTPYALIENVVTDADYRGRGLATECLEFAKEIAEKNGCYKMMLITGSHDPNTHMFYKKAGFFSEGKTAYYKLLKEVNW